MALPKPKPSKAVQQKLKVEKAAVYAKNKEKVLKHLQERGLRNKAIAAIMANIDVETGGSFDFKQKQTKSGSPSDPRTIEGGGVGLFQFDDYKKGVGNQSWYKEYLKDSGKKDSTESQIDYVLDSVFAKNEKDIGWKSKLKIGKGDLEVLEQYLTTTENPRDISDAFVDRFEKAGIPHSDKRRNKTDQYLSELQPVDKTDSFPPERVMDVEAKENKYEGIPFLRYKPVQKLLGLAEGGVIPMERQMDMFQEGGLQDEGGTVDPVSGNEVPPGSTQEEVRDDIPAQLSEGEFVFPADVVRYIGLGNLMQMRQEAKMGLKMMEEMGQMGNSEEATIPDDVPFNVDDLELDDEPREMQVGGFVQPITAATQQQQQMGISGFQQAAAPTTGVAPIPQAASQQFVQPTRPQQAAVPTMQQYQPQEIPSFTQLVGENPGQYDELREYRNEAGMVRMIPFKAGQPIYPIPEGFKFVDPEATQTEEVTTTPTTPQTTSVRMEDADSQSRDEARQRREEEIYGPGGGRLSIGQDTFGVSFDMPEGFVPGITSGLGTAFGLATGKPLPEEVDVNFQFKDTKFTATGTEYNELKAIVKEQGSTSSAAKTKLAEIKENSDLRQIQKDEAEKARATEVEVLGEEFADTAGPGGGMASQTLTAAEQRKAEQRKKEREKREREAAQRRKERLEAEAIANRKRDEQQKKAENVGEGGFAPVRPDPGRDRGSGPADTSSGSAGRGGGGRSGGLGGQSGGPRAKGGLMEAPKPKAKKKMKRGGLASKK